MQIPLQITFHGIDHSDAVETRIREKVAKLEQIFAHITSCRVVIEQQHKSPCCDHHKGLPFHVRVDITVPGDELVVKKDSHEHEEIGALIREAFQAMERQVREFADRQRGEVKSHAAS